MASERLPMTSSIVVGNNERMTEQDAKFAAESYADSVLSRNPDVVFTLHIVRLLMCAAFNRGAEHALRCHEADSTLTHTTHHARTH